MFPALCGLREWCFYKAPASKSRQKVDDIRAAGPAVIFLYVLLFSFSPNGMEQYKSKDYFIAVHFSKAIARNGNTFM